MAEVAEMVTKRTLLLPADVAEHFRPADRFIVWTETEGDTLHLKRITSLPMTEIVGQVQQDDVLSLDEINDIVHEVRRRR